jgi:hypothetical protein
MSQTEGAVRAGIQLIQTELSEIAVNPLSSDIVTATATAVRYHAMRGLGEACEISTTNVEIKQSTYHGLRTPTGGRDQVLLFLDGDTTRTSDDHWHRVGFTGGGNVAGTCPDGSASWVLTFSTALTTLQRDSVWVVSPVRTSEEMEIGSVSDGGATWLGIRSVSGGEGALIPVVGPTSGLAFSYGASDGTESTTPVVTAVRNIRITLTGISERAVTTGVGSTVGSPTEALQIIVNLRNSR